MGITDSTTSVTSRMWWQQLNAATSGQMRHTEVEPLVREHLRWHPRAGIESLRRAYAVAHHLHEGQMRKSGEPYISHPLAVALILAETGVDTATLVAALLHDTVEDTPYSVGQLRAQFGDEVAVMVDGVTKLDRSMYGADAAGETFRKMVLAASADLRVLLIKLADRVHNLRTLGFQPEHKQRRIASATRDLLIPFAERLGVYALKRELEDLCFAYLEPEPHADTVTAIAEGRTHARDEFDAVRTRLTQVLAEFRIRSEVVVRDRHPYSVHTTRGGHLDGLDSFGVSRIIVTVPRESRDCYIALGAIHSAWKPLPARFKDFIAVPKYNLYRALHTTVVTSSGRVFELIVCTVEEYRISEYGLITHVADATCADGRRAVTRRADLDWLQRLLSWQRQVTADELLQGMRTDLVPDSMVIFTREGDLVSLPRGATALDFAYAVSPELGDRYMGAQVDGRLVPAATRLRDGQTVEILTSDDSSASASWLTVVKTGPARSGITQRLAEQQAEREASQGRTEIQEHLRTAGYSLLELEGTGIATSVARRLGYSDLDGLYTATNAGDVNAAELVTELVGSLH